MNETTVKPEDIAKIFKDDLSDYVKKKILEYKPVYSPISKEEEEENHRNGVCRNGDVEMGRNGARNGDSHHFLPFRVS